MACRDSGRGAEGQPNGVEPGLVTDLPPERAAAAIENGYATAIWMDRCQLTEGNQPAAERQETMATKPNDEYAVP